MTSSISLSVIVITKDEEDRLDRCLESIKDLADELIVFDSGSADSTVDIAKRYTDKVYVTDWPGYGPQKQRALLEASNEWVLSIDADEELDEQLQIWVREFLYSIPQGVVGVKLPWAVNVYGKTLKHGRSARAPMRLFQRQGASFTDVPVHEEIVLASGKVITAEGKLNHYTMRDFKHGLNKSADYAWLSSQKYFRKGKRCRSMWTPLLKSMWTFLQVYILRLGALDGAAGFMMAVTYAQGSFNKYAGLWDLTRLENKQR